MAAGFTIEAGKLDAFRAFLGERIHSELEGEPMVPTLSVDAPLAIGGASRELQNAPKDVPSTARRTCPRDAPSAIRIPISAVRRETANTMDP
jgi:single-stranded-DNA-specific exonuclease